jgi:hypothetical protein
MTTTIDGSAGVTTNSGAIYNGIASSSVVTGTTQTSIAFESIPSWVKRITIMLAGLSTSSTGTPLVQLGTGSTTYTTSGYLGSNWWATNTGSNQIANFSSGFGLNMSNNTAASVYHGSISLILVSGNTWVCNFVLGQSNATSASNGGGSIALASALTAVRLYIDGTQQFDAGSINILYE